MSVSFFMSAASQASAKEEVLFVWLAYDRGLRE